MAEEHGEPSMEERYELLQSLCKHQMMINETLKSELSRLSTLYQQVSSERSLLLNELLDHHASCSNAILREKSEALPTTNYRRKVAYDHASTTSKRPRSMRSPTPEVNPDFPLQSKTSHSEDEDMKEDDWLQDNSTTTANPTLKTMPSSPPVPSHLLSKIRNVKPKLSDNVDPLPHSHAYGNSDSPPTISTSHNISAARGFIDQPKPSNQRTSKVSSLLTSSNVSSSSPHVGQYSNCSPAVGVRNIQTSVPSVSMGGGTGVVLNSNESKPSQTQMVFRNPPIPIQSTPTNAATNLKLSCSASGQRIYIQQTNANSRSILVHPPRNSHQPSQPGDTR